MADEITPRLNLVKPEVGGSADTWGDKWNENADKIDAAIVKSDEENVWEAPQTFKPVGSDEALKIQSDGADNEWVVNHFSSTGQLSIHNPANLQASRLSFSPEDGLVVGGNAVTNGMGPRTLNVLGGLYDDGERVYSPNNFPSQLQGLNRLNFDMPVGGPGAVRAINTADREIFYFSTGANNRNDVRLYGDDDSLFPNEFRVRLAGNEVLRMQTNRVDFNQPVYVNGNEVGASLGAGQTWLHVTAQRAWNTTYTNTTGRPIAVFIRAGSPSGRAIITLNIAGSPFVSPLSAGDNNLSTSIFAIIPPGAAYQATSDSNLIHWAELR